jgi:DNA topoisomerase-1
MGNSLICQSDLLKKICKTCSFAGIVLAMSKLVIVESPSKAKTIEKYLGKGFHVEASVGHIRDLPKSNKNAVDIEAGFVPNYVISPRKKDIVAKLKKEAKDADEVILATDPDREGEAIAWHVAEILDLKKSKSQAQNPKVSRVVFHEITKEAVEEAFKHPKDVDMDLVKAQEARRVLDRLFGYDLSGLIWKKVRYGLSAGRVQSPALRIIMEREREIRAFIPEQYFVLTAPSEAKGEEFVLTSTEEPKERKEANRIKKVGEKGSWKVTSVDEKEAKRNPYAPFTTSTLQQTASTRLGFSPSRTMRAAQKLYEKGHITYMRTDSTTLSKGAHGAILKQVEKQYGKDHVEPRVFKTKSKSAQEAHEAIRPSNPSKENAGNSDDETRLYDLIWKRTISSQMKSAKVIRTKIIANIETEDIPDFAVNGSRTIFDGWLKADPGARGEDTEVPKIKEGENINVKEIIIEEKETTPPPRYSEAGLIKELEKRGIGRPSTYASIIQTLQDRKYVDKEGRTLIPTDTGDVVSSFLEEHFEGYISDDFTSGMEDELDDIASGKREYAKTLKDFYGPFTKDVSKKEKEAGKITDLGEAPKEFPCPVCGAPMVIKLARHGKFMSCSKFPDCDGARTIEGEEVKDPEALGEDPETGEKVYVLEGPYGPYVQLGQKSKEKGAKKSKAKKPKRASIPQDKKVEDVTLENALTYLSLPRELGKHPETGESIQANIGRFGPYIAHNIKPKPDYRSLKEDDPYTIKLSRALEILAEPKRRRGFNKKKSR